MTSLQRWWSESGAKAQKTPEYKAEALAIDVAIQIGNRLKELSISRKQLSDRLKVSKAYVSQLLQGKSNMTLLTLCRVADAIELDLLVSMRPRRNITSGTWTPAGTTRVTTAASSIFEHGTIAAAYGAQALVETHAWLAVLLTRPATGASPSGIIEEGMYDLAVGR